MQIIYIINYIVCTLNCLQTALAPKRQQFSSVRQLNEAWLALIARSHCINQFDRPKRQMLLTYLSSFWALELPLSSGTFHFIQADQTGREKSPRRAITNCSTTNDKWQRGINTERGRQERQQQQGEGNREGATPRCKLWQATKEILHADTIKSKFCATLSLINKQRSTKSIKKLTSVGPPSAPTPTLSLSSVQCVFFLNYNAHVHLSMASLCSRYPVRDSSLKCTARLH